MPQRSRNVAITGALGNLGWKLMRHLATHGTSPRLVGLDNRPADRAQKEQLRQLAGDRRVDFVECDLADWADLR